ncbi:16S rRNA (cytosine(1402)-N(4))-methyltransferase RsmH [Salisediminibacterium halotolerans]|uniref:Ribosomal RNA small subunit methyltransferase H n=1 Tax=Salisediminibacterium halotolerans TaxID=517425 RepID=A0A1H9PU40_9BACI|nr:MULTISPECIES: 16S rRNA (cytosine(1402)-N(4))-methyltransferase RsmH [Salisediminibacterium]RLJ74313.1 16S rRNA (cytosine1402-N4)-methyltransferase [Actinophytocola xinjiangensis]RPE87594.1 16S rRNA (cytosine1402-N4)-methyltransferase [Salisediminibacterium halotolerans]TWG35150.1 16S rRNA (cytosine1402-N4)-methyltransferase [Salisediminibacterium halotolerans]SER51796.1 16S rRNA (cytosine1402-N4)-methyltransferase [Salisediminibacterium haloalkalitolerans]GEL07291.1 ribosomal RNA small subu
MFEHDTVLKRETVEGLNIQPEGVYIDCTLGGGGHSEAIAEHLTGIGHLICFDQDEAALAHAKSRLKAWEDRITYVRRNFRFLKEELAELGISGADGIVFDLGVSSPQFDEPERGFSYRYNARLDMRMDQSQTLSAYEVINEWSFHDLLKIISQYGEEKFAKSIARQIEKVRKQAPIETTFELVEVIKEAIPAPARRKGGHPAKRTFQAVRIAVNDELEVFKKALEDAIASLNPGGRIAVITFHSLEDRICKQVFKQKSTPPDLPKDLPVIPKGFEPELTLVNRKPILAGEEEMTANNRAHSAKLRIAEKTVKEAYDES